MGGGGGGKAIFSFSFSSAAAAFFGLCFLRPSEADCFSLPPSLCLLCRDLDYVLAQEIRVAFIPIFLTKKLYFLSFLGKPNFELWILSAPVPKLSIFAESSLEENVCCH